MRLYVCVERGLVFTTVKICAKIIDDDFEDTKNVYLALLFSIGRAFEEIKSFLIHSITGYCYPFCFVFAGAVLVFLFIGTQPRWWRQPEHKHLAYNVQCKLQTREHTLYFRFKGQPKMKPLVLSVPFVLGDNPPYLTTRALCFCYRALALGWRVSQKRNKKHEWPNKR